MAHPRGSGGFAPSAPPPCDSVRARPKPGEYYDGDLPPKATARPLCICPFDALKDGTLPISRGIEDLKRIVYHSGKWFKKNKYLGYLLEEELKRGGQNLHCREISRPLHAFALEQRVFCSTEEDVSILANAFNDHVNYLNMSGVNYTNVLHDFRMLAEMKVLQDNMTYMQAQAVDSMRNGDRTPPPARGSALWIATPVVISNLGRAAPSPHRWQGAAQRAASSGMCGTGNRFAPQRR